MVTVLLMEVVVVITKVVGVCAAVDAVAVVVGRGTPPIAGIGVVTVRGSVVAGNVVNDNAAFFVFGVFTSLFAGASEPPHALMARRAAAVRARAVARGEIFITST